MPLTPGDKAPDFTLLDQHGQPFTLSKSLKQRKIPHLVYFYPKADTPGCTAQSCGLRDVLADETMVVGISRSAFLVDEKGRIAEARYKISPKDTAALYQQLTA